MQKETCSECGKPAEIGDLCHDCENAALDAYLAFIDRILDSAIIPNEKK